MAHIIAKRVSLHLIITQSTKLNQQHFIREGNPLVVKDFMRLARPRTPPVPTLGNRALFIYRFDL